MLTASCRNHIEVHLFNQVSDICLHLDYYKGFMIFIVDACCIALSRVHDCDSLSYVKLINELFTVTICIVKPFLSIRSKSFWEGF